MITSYEGRNIRLPDFLIPGAARSGTTALYEHLRKHPDLFMPDEKEPMFFSICNIGKRKGWQVGKLVEDWTIPDFNEYLELFEKAKEHQKCGESSVWYLYDHDVVIQNIRKFYGEKAADLKIIILLRNPVHRAWSHYVLKCSRMKEPLSFEEAVQPNVIRQRMEKGLSYSYDYIGFGMYTEQIRAWRKAFPNIRIWIHEEFFSNIPVFMEELAEFLEILMHPSLLIRRRVNPSGIHRNRLARLGASSLMGPSLWKSILKPLFPRRFRYRMKMDTLRRLTRPEPMPEPVHRKLTEIYATEINQLEVLLGRSLDIWRDAAYQPTGRS
ncbi:MAG: sulfotransferase domain-containing protein [Acidobacteria bacterium]|nr:sulfotransferase domain-containing protein [Acidobacteriota bacterium]